MDLNNVMLSNNNGYNNYFSNKTYYQHIIDKIKCNRQCTFFMCIYKDAFEIEYHNLLNDKIVLILLYKLTGNYYTSYLAIGHLVIECEHDFCDCGNREYYSKVLYNKQFDTLTNAINDIYSSNTWIKTLYSIFESNIINSYDAYFFDENIIYSDTYRHHLRIKLQNIHINDFIITQELITTNLTVNWYG